MATPYAVIRDQMRTGDMVFFRGHGPFGWLIRAWTQSRYSHVGMIYLLGSRVFLLESKLRYGVRMIPMSRRLDDRPTWVGMDRPSLSKPAEDHALRNIGMRYSIINAIRAGLRYRTVDRGFECAQYVEDIQLADELCLSWLPPTPETLAEGAEKLKKAFVPFE